MKDPLLKKPDIRLKQNAEKVNYLIHFENVNMSNKKPLHCVIKMVI